MDSYELFYHYVQGCFTGTGAITWLPQCQWSHPEGYGWNWSAPKINETRQTINCVHVSWSVLYTISNFLCIGAIFNQHPAWSLLPMGTALHIPSWNLTKYNIVHVFAPIPDQGWCRNYQSILKMTRLNQGYICMFHISSTQVLACQEWKKRVYLMMTSWHGRAFISLALCTGTRTCVL